MLLARMGVRPKGHSDEMRLGLRGQTRKVLAPKGVKVVQRLQLRYEWSYPSWPSRRLRGRSGGSGSRG